MSSSAPTPSMLGDAHAAADAAAERSRVTVRPLVDLADLRDLVALFDRVWSNSGPPQIGLEHLRALSHAGNYVVGAFDAATRELLGGTVAFFAAPPGLVLHSDITGVIPAARDRRLGFALKVHQRAWCLDVGLTEVVWTFDPLIRRNAYFNLVKLRAGIGRYYVDFYGEMDDGINLGQASDRLLATWRLDEPTVADACALRPVAPVSVSGAVPVLTTDGTRAEAPMPHRLPDRPARILVCVPADIETMRRTSPEIAREWRLAVRETLGAALADGGTVVGFDTESGYVVDRSTATGTGHERDRP